MHLLGMYAHPFCWGCTRIGLGRLRCTLSTLMDFGFTLKLEHPV